MNGYIANHYLRACISGAIDQGIKAETLLESANIPLTYLQMTGKRLSSKQLTQLIKCVWRETKDEFMGLAPSPSKNGVFALMLERCSRALTLGAMLKSSAHFYSCVSDCLQISLKERSDNNANFAFFQLELADHKNDPDHLLQEFLLLMWQRLISWFAGYQVPIAMTQFSYPTPRHSNEYAAMGYGELKFNQTTSGFYLHRKYIEIPVNKTGGEIALFLKESPAYVLRKPRIDNSLKTKIGALLAQHNYDAMPGLDNIAAMLNITPRTFARRLKEEGTSFSKIKETAQLEYAAKLMLTENMSISDISEKLGFSESAAFCRAFKRWTGSTPSGWGTRFN